MTPTESHNLEETILILQQQNRLLEEALGIVEKLAISTDYGPMEQAGLILDVIRTYRKIQKEGVLNE